MGCGSRASASSVAAGRLYHLAVERDGDGFRPVGDAELLEDDGEVLEDAAFTA